MLMAKSSVKTLVEDHRLFFGSGETKDITFRIRQLKKLKEAISENEDEILKALKADLNKSDTEAYMTEVHSSLQEIDHAVKNLKRWAKPKRVKTPLLLKPAKSRIISEPLGTVLVIGPWNYPFLLLIAPLAAAIAAGNCVVLKPSELSENTSAVVTKIIRDCFGPEYISVVEGGADETNELLNEKFDHIFYTGGPQVGRIVMSAASKYLTPVTLELGGKSPCIIDSSVNIKMAAKRITWGKFLNAGQTCVAPDYLLVHKNVKDELLSEIRNTIRDFFGEDPKSSMDFGRIINQRHFERLEALIEMGNLYIGGETDQNENYIAPTILHNIKATDKVMDDEIFGPVLPVIEYQDIKEALNFVNERPKPLALYIFTKRKEMRNKVLAETSSGGVCINDTIVHISSTELPFGGVGESGMGSYHGKAGFNTFSHKRSVLQQTTLIDNFLRYPPFSPILKPLLKRL